MIAYDIVDKYGNTPEYAKVEGNKLAVLVDDVSLYGTHELKLKAITNDSTASRLEFGSQSTITIRVNNACALTEVIPTDLEDIVVWAGQTTIVRKTFRFSDKLSNEENEEDICGKLRYSMADEDTLEFIKLLRPLPGSSDDKITILIDVASVDEASLTLIQIQAELEDYPYVTPAVSTFSVEVKAPSVIEVEIEETVEMSDQTEINENAPTLYIHSIDKFGVVEIRFSEPLAIPVNLTSQNSTLFDLNILTQDRDELFEIRFNWTLSEFRHDRCLIQLTFDNPLLISPEIGSDDLL